MNSGCTETIRCTVHDRVISAEEGFSFPDVKVNPAMLKKINTVVNVLFIFFYLINYNKGNIRQSISTLYICNLYVKFFLIKYL